MGINSEYGYDAFNAEDARDDDDQDDNELILDPETWHDWHSENLLDMWMSLRQYLQDNHMSNTIMNHATFHSFCEYVRAHSS